MVVILREADVQQPLPMSTAIDAREAAFRALAIDAFTTNLPRRPEDITMFKSVGLAIEDVAVASHVYRAALEHGVGERIAFSGSWEDSQCSTC